MTTEPSQCSESTKVSVSYPYNAHDPSFTQLFGEATIAEADACNADPASAACEAVFDFDFSGVDADGDALEYSIVPVIDNSNVFIIPDPSKLAISYVGTPCVHSVLAGDITKSEEEKGRISEKCQTQFPSQFVPARESLPSRTQRNGLV